MRTWRETPVWERCYTCGVPKEQCECDQARLMQERDEDARNGAGVLDDPPGYLS